MTEPPLRVSLVEDNPGDAELVRERLRGQPFDLKHDLRLADGIDRALEERPDVVLLDLNLPDSDGISTVERYLKEVPGIPVVVLTVLDNEELGVAAVDLGAQDYLVKEQVQTALLTRALRFAVLRHTMAASEVRRARSLEDEVRRLRAILGTREPGPREALRSKSPEAFAELVDRFKARTHAPVDDRRGGVVMARMMADMGAGPRDVMDVYGEAFESAMSDAQGTGVEDREALAARLRIVALELMGRLVELYSAAGPRGRGLAGRERGG